MHHAPEFPGEVKGGHHGEPEGPERILNQTIPAQRRVDLFLESDSGELDAGVVDADGCKDRGEQY